MAGWINASREHAQSKIDSSRARKIGQLLVDASAAGETQDLPLLSFNDFKPTEVLAEYNLQQSRFQTAPFDPSGDKFRFFPGQVTIWSGFPGAGKTSLLRQLACHLLHRGESVFFASLEERPTHLIVRLAATAAGMRVPDDRWMLWFCDFYADRLKVWGTVGVAKHRRIFGALQELRCGQAIIDSLMCLDIDNDNWNAQRVFINELCALAEQTGTHVHLVAHPKKPMAQGQRPSTSDVAGAKEIGARADNVLFIRRGETEQFGDGAGLAVDVLKQRHEGMLGEIKGWYHRNWRQFHVEQFPQGPTRYLPNEAYT